MSKKLVSVIIPSFKMGAFIGEALESVGAQMYPHWEVIVVDDAGPEDGTRAAVEAFSAKHPDHRVEYIRHDTNQGVSVARRTAFEAARGEYIAFLDADDVFLPEKLSRHVPALQQNKRVALVHGPVVELGESKQVGGSPGIFDQGVQMMIYHLWDRTDALSFNQICTSTVLCRRQLLKAGDFPEKMLFQYEDWLLWLLLGRRGERVYEPTPLTRYRFHESSYSAASVRAHRQHDFAQVEMILALFGRLDDGADRHAVALRLVALLNAISAEHKRTSADGPGRRASLPSALALSAASAEARRLAGRLGGLLGEKKAPR